MYERFTDRARKVLQLAMQEAETLGHERIGTEHILLGLIKEGDGGVANVFKNLDVDLDKVRVEVEKLVQKPETAITGKLPTSARAAKVIKYALEEARNLHHSWVGTEHLLLGLLRDGECTSSQVLKNLGLKAEELRKEVLNLLGHELGSDPP